MSEELTKPPRHSRRKFLKSAGLVPAALYLDGCAATGGQKTRPAAGSGVAGSMMDYSHPPLDTVRVGIIGMALSR